MDQDTGVPEIRGQELSADVAQANEQRAGGRIEVKTGKSKARDIILEKLQSRIEDSTPLFRCQDQADPSAGMPCSVTTAGASGKALAKTFGENLSAVLGSYEIAENSVEVAQRAHEQIERWREQHNGTAEYGREILSWAPTELPVPNLSAHLKKLGVSLFVPSDLHQEEERAHAATLSVGLTGVDAAFAGTGSIVLVPGPGKSRVASLLPLHHIALVPISRIHSTFEDWLAGLRREGRLEKLFRNHAQLAFVTGPSKSADIELILTLGVHGPRDVHAIVFEEMR